MTTTEYIQRLSIQDAKKLSCLLFTLRSHVEEKHKLSYDLFLGLLRAVDEDYHSMK